MRKKSRITLVLLLVAILAAVAYYLLLPHQPTYQGRSLSSWLHQLDDGNIGNSISLQSWTAFHTHEQTQAAEAIRHMGTNALPYLLQSLTKTNSTLRNTAIMYLRKHPWLKTHLPDLKNNQNAAGMAFDALGPIAKPALPELIKALNSGVMEPTKAAAIALAAVGPEGRDALVAAVSSTNGSTPICAIWALASHHLEVPPGFIESLVKRGTNNLVSSDILVIWAVKELAPDHPQLIPMLTNALASKNMSTRLPAALFLGEMGTNALSAVPALLNAAQNSDPTTAAQAKRALQYIQPGAIK